MVSIKKNNNNNKYEHNVQRKRDRQTHEEDVTHSARLSQAYRKKNIADTKNRVPIG